MNIMHQIEKKRVWDQSPKWEYYCCSIDDYPSIISADLGLADQAPNPRLHHLFYLSIKVSNTNKQGLPTPSALGTLCRLEDKALEVFRHQNFSFAGRISTNGCRDLIFYTNTPLALKRLSAELMQSFPEFSYEAGQKQDKSWDFYFNFLFPKEKELNTILNQRKLMRLEAKGEDLLDEDFTLEHRFYFKNKDERDNFILHAIDDYFHVEQIGLDGDSPKHPWLLHISRSERLELKRVNQLTMDLMRKVQHHSGIYDGWEVQKTGH